MSEIEQRLETARLVLEPLVVPHTEPFYTAVQAPEVYQFIPREPPPSLEHLAARYAILATRHSPDGQERWLNLALRQRETGA